MSAAGTPTVRDGSRPAERPMWRVACTALALACILLAWSGRALAQPVWSLSSTSNTTAAPGGTVDYLITAQNVGDAPTDLSPYTLTVTLPPGMTGASFVTNGSDFDCPGVAGAPVVTCTGSAFVDRYATAVVIVTANVPLGGTGIQTASFEIDGGGASGPASTVDPVTISSTPPGFGIDAFDATASDAAGDPLTQAGGHPTRLTTSIDFNTVTDPSPAVGALRTVEPVKDIAVDLPPGFVGNPTAADRCTMSELTNVDSSDSPASLCPETSQVGTAVLKHSGDPGGAGANVFGPVPLYNMVPSSDVPARFGFVAARVVVLIDAKPRAGGDYGITARAANVSEGLAVVGTTLRLWGVPSDASHNGERACRGQVIPLTGGPTCTSGAAPKPFFRNPTSCTAPGVGLPTTLHIDSWEHPGVFQEKTFVSHLLPGYPFAPQDWGAPVGTDGCASVPFDPTFSAQPLAGSTAAAPASMAFDVAIPQTDDVNTIGQSDLRSTTVTLPQGVRVSPSSADGLQACSQAQIALRSDAEPTCPEASKLGSVQIDTPLLDVPVKGSLYLATPFANPFGSLVAIYMVASAQGVTLKLPGRVSMDGSTGQISTTFDNTPQLPFSRLHLEFKTGPRTPLAMPRRCGLYDSHATFVGWNGRTVERDSSFVLSENAKGQPCPPQFSPGFSAGTASNSAGSSSSFLLRFTRADEDQELSGLSVTLARGLTGRIAKVDLCSDGQARSNACPASSKVGDVTVGAGAGSEPFFITNGRAYLTGPYKGAPYGVAIVVPAVAGPFDLGDVTVRSGLFVDKKTAQVRIVSDPFPTILQGIPLDVRDVRVNVDKPGFFLNPTSCAVKTIAGVLTSTEGAKANVSDRFQAAECGSLGFKPRMAMHVGGRGHTHRGQTSPFSTTLTMPQRDQANLRYVRVTLPKTINARLNTIQDACTRTEFENDVRKCAHAVAGSATASTPLLRAPLRGNVYFVKNGHAIPDLFVALRGQVAFDLVGRISIVDNRLLRTTFDAAPDVPIRSFTLRLLGGSSTASIGAVSNLCSAKSRRAKAQVDYIGQNGKVRQVQQALQVGGCAKHRVRRGGRR